MTENQKVNKWLNTVYGVKCKMCADEWVAQRFSTSGPPLWVLDTGCHICASTGREPIPFSEFE
jgi:hypothetical protein